MGDQLVLRAVRLVTVEWSNIVEISLPTTMGGQEVINVRERGRRMYTSQVPKAVSAEEFRAQLLAQWKSSGTR